MSTSIAAITFDCADAVALANFWAGVFERSIDDGASDEFASVTGAILADLVTTGAAPSEARFLGLARLAQGG